MAQAAPFGLAGAVSCPQLQLLSTEALGSLPDTLPLHMYMLPPARYEIHRQKQALSTAAAKIAAQYTSTNRGAPSLGPHFTDRPVEHGVQE